MILADHLESVMIAASIDALSAALALRGIDEDSKLAAADTLLLENVEVLVRCCPLSSHGLAFGRITNLVQRLFKNGRLDDLAEDCGVRALRHALHTTDAILCDKRRDIGGNVAEI